MTDRSHDMPGASARLAELLADERAGQLAPEDRAELEALLASEPDAEVIAAGIDEAIGRALVAADEIDRAGGAGDAGRMPASFRARLKAQGEALAGGSVSAGAAETQNNARDGGPIPMASGRDGRRGIGGWVAAAACLLLAGGIALFAMGEIRDRDRLLVTARADAEARIEENQRLLADARAELAAVSERYTRADERRLELLEQLADATSRLDRAELTIARLEAPEDPAVLAQRREQLLDVNGTIRVAWQPFEVPGLPDAEQPGVDGDVVWNDNLQQGFLRFQGLKVNDPSEEQYQVWVIDERGMEQKVSGGVFNATADGEIIVPIEPGIDVGSVQVFAITVEAPGGIWVPDLKRRVVVAPRGEDG